MKVVFALFAAAALSLGTCTELLTFVLVNREIPRNIGRRYCKSTRELSNWLHGVSSPTVGFAIFNVRYHCHSCNCDEVVLVAVR